MQTISAKSSAASSASIHATSAAAAHLAGTSVACDHLARGPSPDHLVVALELPLAFLRENRLPVVLIRFGYRLLALTPAVAGRCGPRCLASRLRLGWLGGWGLLDLRGGFSFWGRVGLGFVFVLGHS